MGDIKFRELRSDELEVRVAREIGQNKDKVELLIYKDSRVDMRVLDETVGNTHWCPLYRREGETLICRLGIYVEEFKQFLYKEAAGDKTNIEQIKGEQSEALKRAASVWGIGRALYTAPKIIVPGTKYDSFKVASIGYADNKISDLVITCKGRVVFNYQNFNVVSTASAKSEDNLTLLKAFCREQLDNQLASEKVLTKFYNFYAGKIGSWQNTPNFERLLDKWITSEY